VVESTALEMRRAGNGTVGSNPTLSASYSAEIRSLLGRVWASDGTITTLYYVRHDDLREGRQADGLELGRPTGDVDLRSRGLRGRSEASSSSI
jgi:hypothetical protein